MFFVILIIKAYYDKCASDDYLTAAVWTNVSDVVLHILADFSRQVHKVSVLGHCILVRPGVE